MTSLTHSHRHECVCARGCVGVVGRIMKTTNIQIAWFSWTEEDWKGREGEF